MAKNMYSLKDIRALINFEGSPFSEFKKQPECCDCTPCGFWYLLSGEYDKAISVLIAHSFTHFYCHKPLERIFFAPLEDLPIHLVRPEDCRAEKDPDELIRQHLKGCTVCADIAKWRLGRGK